MPYLIILLSYSKMSMIDHWIKRNIPSFGKYFSALHFFNSVRGASTGQAVTKLRLKSEIPDSPKLGYEVHQVGILQLLIGAGWEGRESELAQLS